MDDEEILEHTGVLGMRWGIRKSTVNSKSSVPKQNKKQLSLDAKKKASDEKRGKNLTNDEIRDRVNRLELERKYTELNTQANKAQVSKGKAFVSSVLENSAKSIATQTTTYFMGQAVNSIVGKDIIKPKTK